VFLLLIKIPFIVFLLTLLALANLLKWLFCVPFLIRLFERVANHCISRMLLSAFSANNILAQYHQEHKDWSYLKAEKGELQVNDIIGGTDIILCNRASLIDFLFLEMSYGPVYTTAVFDSKTQKCALRKLAPKEVFYHALGIHFPETDYQGEVIRDLDEFQNGQKIKRPIVVTPEVSRTNGKGTLVFEEGITDMVLKAAQSK
jgi:hypothetical protein